jgi:hypothetical protein
MILTTRLPAQPSLAVSTGEAGERERQPSGRPGPAARPRLRAPRGRPAAGFHHREVGGAAGLALCRRGGAGCQRYRGVGLSLTPCHAHRDDGDDDDDDDDDDDNDDDAGWQIYTTLSHFLPNWFCN